MLCRTTVVASAALFLIQIQTASAHIQLNAPKPRTTGLKSGPCGDPGSTRSANVCEFRPGATIVISWDETVEHPGHFRIAFDQDGNDDFVNPTGFDDTSGGPGVLIDGIADRDVSGGDRTYTQEIQLPNVECDNCTLQVIQVMSDKPPYDGSAAGNDIYYQCADVTLSATAPAEPADGCAVGGTGGSDAGAGGSGGDGGDDSSGGCTAAGAPGAAGVAWLLPFALGLAALRARRRRRC